MPAQRQTNAYPHTAHLPEARDEDGTIFPSTSVDPGESVDWPHPVAGFTGWTAERAEPEAADPDPAPESAGRSGAEAGAEALATSAKTRSKASAKSPDQEVAA